MYNNSKSIIPSSMSKLQPLLLDNGQIIFVATTGSELDDSDLQKSRQPSPHAAETEEEMSLSEPNLSLVPDPEDADVIDTPQSKDLKSFAHKAQKVLTTPITLPILDKHALDPEALEKAASQTLGDLVQGYTGYLLSNFEAVATTHEGVKKVTLEFGINLELDTGKLMCI